MVLVWTDGDVVFCALVCCGGGFGAADGVCMRRGRLLLIGVIGRSRDEGSVVDTLALFHRRCKRGCFARCCSGRDASLALSNTSPLFSPSSASYSPSSFSSLLRAIRVVHQIRRRPSCASRRH